MNIYKTNCVDKGEKTNNTVDDNQSIPRPKTDSAARGGKIRTVTGKVLSKLSKNTKDGVIGNTRQRMTGNCGLLSGVNALSYCNKGRSIISQALEYKDRGTIVHLKGVGDYFIPDSLVAATKTSAQYSDCDDDMVIFELAVEAARDDIQKGNIRLSYDAPWYFARELQCTRTGYSSTERMFSGELFYMLTGKVPKMYTDKKSIENALKAFNEDNNENMAMAGLVNNIESIALYDKDGNVETEKTFKYSEDGDIIGKTQKERINETTIFYTNYDSNGKIVSTERVEYTKNGCIKLAYNSEGELISKTVEVEEEDGQQRKDVIYYNADGSIKDVRSVYCDEN